MLLDILDKIYNKSLPNWVDKKSVLLSWIKAALADLKELLDNYLNETDSISGSEKAISNWLENQTIYVDESNIQTFDTESYISKLIKRGTAAGFVELAYYLDNNKGSFETQAPVYTQTTTNTSMTWTGTHAIITIYKTTLEHMSTHFWLADVTTPSDALIQHTTLATDSQLGIPVATTTTDYVGPAVSHVTIEILKNYRDQSTEDTQNFIRKHFIPAGLPAIFI